MSSRSAEPVRSQNSYSVIPLGFPHCGLSSSADDISGRARFSDSPSARTSIKIAFRCERWPTSHSPFSTARSLCSEIARSKRSSSWRFASNSRSTPETGHALGSRCSIARSGLRSLGAGHAGKSISCSYGPKPWCAGIARASGATGDPYPRRDPAGR